MRTKNMNIVEPIRDRQKIKNIKKIMKEDGNTRDLLFFQSGLVTALRAGDILKLQVKDVMKKDGSLKTIIAVKESKTGKINRTKPTKNLKDAWASYTKAHPMILTNQENYLIFRTKLTTDESYGEHPISMRQAYNIIIKATTSVGLQGNYGTHTLRKTYGYHARMGGNPIVMIQKKLNHSSPGITLDYIGLTQEELDEVNHSLDL